MIMTAALMPLILSAQAQITTKKMILSDFPQKITKVVLTGNHLLDNILKDEINSLWRISPYEFCDLADFEANKSKSDYYFLLDTKENSEDGTGLGIEFLTLVKGGEGAEEGIGNMFEVCSFPFRAAKMPDGREFDFLPAIIDVIQDYVECSMKKDRDAYGGFGRYNSNLKKTAKMNVVIAEEDLSGNMGEQLRKSAEGKGIVFAESDDADGFMTEGRGNTVVSYVVAPSDPDSGSYYYKMLFGADDHILYYFRRQRIGRDGSCGFSAADLKKLAALR